MKKKTVVLVVVAGIIVLMVALLAVLSPRENKAEDNIEKGEMPTMYDSWPIYPECIIDFCYDTQEDVYYIEYQVYKPFIEETDSLQGHADYGDMKIYCSESDFFGLLDIFKTLDTNNEGFHKPIREYCYRVFADIDGGYGRLQREETDN